MALSSVISCSLIIKLLVEVEPLDLIMKYNNYNDWFYLVGVDDLTCFDNT